MNRKINILEQKTIGLIADRAVAIWAQQGSECPRIDVVMDLMAVHGFSCRLDLDRLLAADDAAFWNDVAGINQHLDRKTYELKDCFWPRFALAHQSAPTVEQRIKRP